jgi:hypothetical protein
MKPCPLMGFARWSGDNINRPTPGQLLAFPLPGPRPPGDHRIQPETCRAASTPLGNSRRRGVGAVAVGLGLYSWERILKSVALHEQ